MFQVDVDLISLRSSIEEVAQCPVCLELVKPPVTLCVNGHGMCTACKATLTKCPTCRKPFCGIEPRILNEILEKIPRVCKYYAKGCRNPAIDDHEVYCKFRTVKCIFPHEDNSADYCDWEGPAHYWSRHHVYCNEFPHMEPCWVDIDDKEKLKIRKFKESVQTKSIFDHCEINEIDEEYDLFDLIFYYTKLNGNFCMYIKHFPLKKPTEVIYFTISFGDSTDDEVMYKYKIKATTMISLERDVKVEENLYCMRVPVEELEKFIDENGDLRINYKVTTEPL